MTTAGELHVIVPGLLGPVSPAFQSLLPHQELRRLLARSDFTPNASDTLDTLQCCLFGLQAEDGRDLPIAPLSYALEGSGELRGRYMLCADPVTLTPGHHSLMLSGSEAMGLEAEEVSSIIALLNKHVVEEGMRFEAASLGRWYLALPEDPQINTVPYSAVLEQAINQALPTGEGGRRWHTFLAEIQMLLHSWSGNLQRQLDNRPMLNSLWFWGGGSLPFTASLSTDWQQVWSDDRVLMALASAAHCPRRDVPSNIETWLASTSLEGRHLLQIPAPPLTEWDEVHDAWLQQLYREWLRPLIGALTQGQLATLTLHTTGGEFRLTRKFLGRWWRRRSLPLQRLQA